MFPNYDHYLGMLLFILFFYSRKTHEGIFMEIILCRVLRQEVARVSHMENELRLLMQTWKIAGPFMGCGAVREGSTHSQNPQHNLR